MSDRVRRILWRAALDDTFAQEDAVKELLQSRKAKAIDESQVVEAVRTITAKPLTVKTSTAVAIGQGLRELMQADLLTTHMAVRLMIDCLQATVRAMDEQSASDILASAPGHEAAVRADAPTHALVCVYTSSLAELCTTAVSLKWRDQGQASLFTWTEQCPLIQALTHNPQVMASPFFSSGLIVSDCSSNPCMPQLTLPAVLAPVLASILFDRQLLCLRRQLVQSLALAPLDYLPQPAVLSLALTYAELLWFMPLRDMDDTDLLLDWARLVFAYMCRLEDDVPATTVGRPLARFLVEYSSRCFEGNAHPESTSVTAAVMLHRIADYDPTLLRADLPLLAYMLSRSNPGPQRSALLATVQVVLAAGEAWGPDAVTRRQLLWVMFPVIALAARAEQAACHVLASLERALARKRQGSSAAAPLSSPGGPTTALQDVLEQPPETVMASLERWRAGLVKGDKDEAGKGLASAQGSMLFLVMGVLFDDDHSLNARAVAVLEAMLDTDALLGHRILPTALYVLKAWHGRPAAQHKMLWLLPKMGRHQLTAPVVQGVLRGFASAATLAGSSDNDGATGERVKAVLRSTCLTLSTRLYRLNTRTLPRLQALIAAEDGGVDECRVAKAQAVLEVIKDNPEAASDFVGLVQEYLMDPLPGVVAIAVDCVTYLCTADCLDYLAAVRILSKKGRVYHKDHIIVLENLADLYGAAVHIFDCSPTPQAPHEDDEALDETYGRQEEEIPRLPDDALVKLTDRLWDLTAQPHGSVRGRAYTALIGYVPAVLASSEEQPDVPVQLRQRLFDDLKTERSVAGRAGLEQLVAEVLRTETEDAATWRKARGLTTTASGASEGAAPPKVSRKTLKALPTATEVCGMYKKENTGGWAGATLHAVAAEPTQAAGVKGGNRLAGLMAVLGDALSDEDLGGRCMMQRVVAVQSFRRFVMAIVRCGAANDTHNPLAGMVEAVDGVEKLIMQEMHNPAARNINTCFLGVASLACALPSQLSHKVPELLKILLDAQATAATKLFVDIPTLQISIGLVASAMGASDAQDLLLVLDRLVGARNAFATRTDLDWCLWGTWLGVGAAAQWAQQQYSPDLTTLTVLCKAATGVVGVISERIGGQQLRQRLCGRKGVFGAEGMVPNSAAGDPASIGVLTWDQLSSGSEALRQPKQDTSADDVEVTGAFMAVSLLAGGVIHAGLERQMLQLLHLSRAAAELGVAGAELALATCASLGLKVGLVTSDDVFQLFRLLGSRIDSGTPSEGVLLGIANLVVGSRASVTLPSGFVEDLSARLLNMARAGDSDQGRSIAALLAVYTLLANGGPTYAPLGLSVGDGIDLGRSTAAMTTSLTETLKSEASSSSSHRVRSAAARLLGLLVALRWHDAEDAGDDKRQALANRLQIDTFGLPITGTLSRSIFEELIKLAVGSMDVGAISHVEGRGFIATTLRALSTCETLRVSHRQMVLLLQNYVKASTSEDLLQACIMFAVKWAPKCASYATWLYDVAINASTAAVHVLLGHLDAVIQLAPSGLVEQLLSSVWGRLQRRAGGTTCSDDGTAQRTVYGRLSCVLGSVTAALEKKGKDQGVRAGILGFLEKQAWPYVCGDAFTAQLCADLEQAGANESDTSFAVVESLAHALCAFPQQTLMEVFGLGKGSNLSEGYPSLVVVIVTARLVSAGTFPSAALEPLRLRLIGPQYEKDLPGQVETLAAVPALVAPLMGADTPIEVQREWTLALLGYLHVAPGSLRPLALLSLLLSQWYPSEAMLLVENVKEDLFACRQCVRSVEEGRLRADDWLRLNALHRCGARMLSRMKPEDEVEVLSAVINVVSGVSEAVSCLDVWKDAVLVGNSQRGLLLWVMVALVKAETNRCRALETGALPMLRVMIAKCIIAASAAHVG